MNKESEDYLDQLLNSVQEPQSQTQEPSSQEQEADSRTQELQKEEWAKDSAQEDKSAGVNFREDFIREFEQELDGLDEDEFISDFERSLEPDLLSDEQEQINAEEESFFAGLDKAMDVENEETPSSETEVLSEEAVSEEDEEAVSEEDEEDFFFGVQENLMEEPDKELSNQEDANPESGEADAEQPEYEMGDTAQPEQEQAEAAQPDDADDILSLLDGLGEENEDIADISKLLKADENNETIEQDGEITAESVAESLAALGFEVSPEDADELASLEELPEKSKREFDEPEEEPKNKKKSKKRKSKKDSEQKDPKDKQGFLKRMKNLFFGPEEEELSSEEESEPQDDLFGEVDENLDILRSLESGEDSSEEGKKSGRKKKATKEEKKQAAAAKKEAKAKEKEAKKKEKAAAKAMKPKKEKPPKQKDNTPPLPKKPVFLIFVFAATILVGVLILGKGLNRQLAMSSSEKLYSQGEYVKAYGEIAGLELKDSEKEEANYRKKLEILAGVQELQDSYELLEREGRPELALDCLIRIIGHYDAEIDAAGELGCSEQLKEYEKFAEELLKETYHTSYEEALRIYKIRSRVRYSTELVKILKEAGLDKWDK